MSRALRHLYPCSTCVARLQVPSRVLLERSPTQAVLYNYAPFSKTSREVHMTAIQAVVLCSTLLYCTECSVSQCTRLSCCTRCCIVLDDAFCCTRCCIMLYSAILCYARCWVVQKCVALQLLVAALMHKLTFVDKCSSHTGSIPVTCNLSHL